MSSFNLLFCSRFCFIVFWGMAITAAAGQGPAAAPVEVALPPAPPVAALSPSASAPGPAGPPNVTAILEKAGRFSTLIKLMATTQVASETYKQLNDTGNSLTILAPDDAAFAALSKGTLNSLNDQQKTSLLQYHIIPTFLTVSQFQTLSNPVRTLAGDVGRYEYPLNVTAFKGSVTVSTGVDNTTVDAPLYSDNQLAIYELDKVLLPLGLFGPKPPAPAPSPALPKEKSSPSIDLTPPTAATTTSKDSSGATAVPRLRESTAVAVLVGAAVGVLWL